MNEQRMFLPRLEVEQDQPGALLSLSSRRCKGRSLRAAWVFLMLPLAFLGALFAAAEWCLTLLASALKRRPNLERRVWLSPGRLSFCAATGRFTVYGARWWWPWSRLFSWPISSLENIRIESRLSLWQDASVALLFESREAGGRVHSFGALFRVACVDTREKVLDLAFRIAQISGIPWYSTKQERPSALSLALASPTPGESPFRPKTSQEGFFPVPWQQAPARYHEDRLDLSTLPLLGTRSGFWTYWVFLAAVLPCLLGFSYWQTNRPGPQCKRLLQTIERFCSESGLTQEALLFCQTAEATLPALEEESFSRMERQCAKSNLVLPRALRHMR